MSKFALILFFTLIALLTPRSIQSQWVQQTLPVSGSPYSIIFLNQNTGFISLDIPALLKTTNGGTNWNVIGNFRIYNMYKIDSTTIYANGRLTGVDKIYRTTNTGISWDSVGNGFGSIGDISFINKDTGWICGHDGNLGAIWKTTNGGLTLTEELSSGTSGMDRIFFLSQKVNGENIGWCSQGNIFRKTTNSGTSWFQAASISAGNEIYFINKDTGWISNGGMFKSTDGGASWINEPMPNDPSFVFNSMIKFSVINNNLLYGVGGMRFFSGGQDRGVIWKTTNGGLNWGYQQPDTSISAGFYGVIYFTDSLTGWAYDANGNHGIHTTNGGGQIIFTGVQQISTQIPSDFKLYQNYPNPFNPSTKIKFQISKTGYTEIKIFDILGRELTTIVKEHLKAGIYEADFDAKIYSSGIYFCRLYVNGGVIDTKKMSLIK